MTFTDLFTIPVVSKISKIFFSAVLSDKNQAKVQREINSTVHLKYLYLSVSASFLIVVVDCCLMLSFST